ncbi:MAG: hypothetical protein RSE13_25575 [Planktothrix sp. GU0601_MAG3]|nr:MAG: hypothetical protein RSE13_25575 [Planktothrix sp. GU0601_MAG3]
MNQAILVNLREAFFNAPGFWQTRFLIKTGNWCKSVDGLDKSRTDGYSILGSFVNQCDQLATQQPGLYLFCEKKKQKQNVTERLYTLFILETRWKCRSIKRIKNRQ